MPRITDIKETKKGRYALFCDDVFLFSIDDETYYKSNIHVDDEIDDYTLEQLRRDSDQQKAKDKAFSLLALREHGEVELYRKLLRSFDEPTARYAVDVLKRLGYIDDVRVLNEQCRVLFEGKHFSIRRATEYLYSKGYDRQVIADAVEPYRETETERIIYLAERKYAGKDKKKAFDSLLRLGFSSSDIRAALSVDGEDE